MLAQCSPVLAQWSNVFLIFGVHWGIRGGESSWEAYGGPWGFVWGGAWSNIGQTHRMLFGFRGVHRTGFCRVYKGPNKNIMITSGQEGWQ